MFHRQLIGGTTVQFKNITTSGYVVTKYDIGKTLRITQNCSVSIGRLPVVDGSMFTIENTGSFTITITGFEDVVVQGGTVSIPANSNVSFIKTSLLLWKSYSSDSGSGSGSGSGVTYSGEWNMAPSIDNVEKLTYVFDGIIPEGASIAEFPTKTPNSATFNVTAGNSPTYGIFNQTTIDTSLFNQPAIDGLNLAYSVPSVVRPIQLNFSSTCPSFPTGVFPSLGQISSLMFIGGKDVVSNDEFLITISILTAGTPIRRSISVTGSKNVSGVTTSIDQISLLQPSANASTGHRFTLNYYPHNRSIGVNLDGTELGFITTDGGNNIFQVPTTVDFAQIYFMAAHGNIDITDPVIGSQIQLSQTINVANIIDAPPVGYSYEQWGDISVTPAAIPNGAVDGNIYKVTGAGTVLSVDGRINDYMLIAENVSRLIPIRNLDSNWFEEQAVISMADGGYLKTSIETRLDPIEADIISLQLGLQDVSVRGKMVTETITGSQEGPTVIDLTTTDNGNFKRIVWTNPSPFDVQFTAADNLSEWFHFFFMLDMPDSNEFNSYDIHINITIGANTVVDYYFNANRLKYQIWEYSCGQIRPILMKQTNATIPVDRPNPVYADRTINIPITQGYNNTSLMFSSYDRVTITPNEEITGASMSLITLVRGQVLQHIFDNGIYIEINATVYGVSGLVIDGNNCPSVPQGEVRKYIFYPYHGGFVQLF